MGAAVDIGDGLGITKIAGKKKREPDIRLLPGRFALFFFSLSLLLALVSRSAFMNIEGVLYL
jgi:hypothetical protein